MNEKKCVSLQMNKSTSFPYIPLIMKLMVRKNLMRQGCYIFKFFIFRENESNLFM